MQHMFHMHMFQMFHMQHMRVGRFLLQGGEGGEHLEPEQDGWVDGVVGGRLQQQDNPTQRSARVMFGTASDQNRTQTAILPGRSQQAVLLFFSKQQHRTAVRTPAPFLLLLPPVSSFPCPP